MPFLYGLWDTVVLIRNAPPHIPGHLNTSLGEGLRDFCLARGNIPLRGLWELKYYPTSSQSSLLNVCIWRHELSASCSCHYACDLMLCLPPWRSLISLEPQAPKPLLSITCLAHGVSTQQQKSSKHQRCYQIMGHCSEETDRVFCFDF